MRLHRLSLSVSSTPRRAVAATFALALAALLPGLVASCSIDPAAPGSPAPCETVYADQCGGACIFDTDCPAGLYCGPGGCTADCAPGDSPCPDGLTCSDRGRCGGGGAGSGSISVGVGAGGGGAGGGNACPDVEVTFQKQIPTVLLLVDQSGSMVEPFPGAFNRWHAVYDSLMDPQDGVVQALDGEIRFGLALYTYSNGGPVCPVLTEVSYAIGNYEAIEEAIDQAYPVEDTPTGDSIDAVVPGLLAYPEPGPKVIVLVTDGEPDTCEEPDPQNGQAESVAAAQNAFAQGIPIKVISVGADTSQTHLQDMANAGAGLPVGGADNAPYYLALDQQTLISAFNDIIYGVRSCVIELDGTLSPEDAVQGHVFLDGAELTFDDPDGWRFIPPNQVELLGDACQAIQSGDHEIQVKFPCGVVTPE